MILKRKIKASALLFAILVSAIIAILLASFLLLTNTHRFFNIQSNILFQTIEASQEGIDFFSDPKNKISDSLEIQSDLALINVKKNVWGGYLMAESNSKINNKSFLKKALLGAKKEVPSLAIYSSNFQAPLYLMGESYIEGDCYVSSHGIMPKPGSNYGFKGSTLFNGNIKRGSVILPALDKDWLKSISSLLGSKSVFENEVSEIKEVNKNSFFKPTAIFYTPNKLVLTQTFIGNIIIKSDEEIVITKYARIEDVQLAAPKITIEKGFSGILHLLASKNIFIDENCDLKYPSSLVLHDDRKDLTIPIEKGEEPIYISNRTHFEGNIIYLKQGSVQENTQSNVVLNPEATIVGDIYCEGNLELGGTLKGSAFTEGFMVNEFGTKFFNHIFNGKILSKDQHKNFCGLPFSEKKKGVVQWLY